METQQHSTEETSITKEYEQRALEAFSVWYWQDQPTLSLASTQAHRIARETVGSLTPTRVILLLQEHPGWVEMNPQETYDSDRGGVSIGEVTRRHLVQHLRKVIEERGMKTAYVDMPPVGR